MYTFDFELCGLVDNMEVEDMMTKPRLSSPSSVLEVMKPRNVIGSSP